MNFVRDDNHVLLNVGVNVLIAKWPLVSRFHHVPWVYNVSTNVRLGSRAEERKKKKKSKKQVCETKEEEKKRLTS